MEEEHKEKRVDDEMSTPPNRWVIRCCAVLIIVIFVTALILGYASWFTPHPSPFP